MKSLLIFLIGLAPASLFAGAGEIDDFDRSRPERSLFEQGDLQRQGGEFEGRTGHEMGDISLGGSAGIAFDEVGLLSTAEADFWFTRFFSAGPLVQVNFSRDLFLVAGGGPKITFDFDDNSFSRLVKPYVGFGPAFVLASGSHNHHHGHRHHDHGTDVGFGVVLNTGVDFYIWEDVSLGTGFIWNWMVTRPLGDRFYFGWKVVEAKYHF